MINRQKLLTQLFDSSRMTSLPQWCRDLLEEAATFIIDREDIPGELADYKLALLTVRRTKAVETLIAEGWKFNGVRWYKPPSSD